MEVEKPKMSYSLGSTGLLPLGRGSSGAGPPPLLTIKVKMETDNYFDKGPTMLSVPG